MTPTLPKCSSQKINVRLPWLVDASYSFQRPDVERILRPTIAWTFTLDLALRFFLALGLLSGRRLGFGQDMALPCYFGLQRP